MTDGPWRLKPDDIERPFAKRARPMFPGGRAFGLGMALLIEPLRRRPGRCWRRKPRLGDGDERSLPPRRLENAAVRTLSREALEERESGPRGGGAIIKPCGAPRMSSDEPAPTGTIAPSIRAGVRALPLSPS